MKLRFSASLVLIILCVIFFLLQNGSELLFGFDFFLITGAKINQFIFTGQFWRFFTPVFLHGSIYHLAFNMYALYSIGPSLEKKYGTNAFLLLFFFGGIFGNVFSFLFSTSVSLGSSTAIFGLIAAQGVYIYQNRLLLGRAANRLLQNVLIMVAINLALGLSPGIDNWGHLGGLVGGFLFAWFAGPNFGISENEFGNHVIVKKSRQVTMISIGLFLFAAILVFLRFQFR